MKDCKIVFSRVFPTKFPAESHHLWKMAEQLGAKCLTEHDSSVTHVVSTDVGTEKSRWAVKENKFLVHPQWIEAANFLWQKQPEENFPVKLPKGEWKIYLFSLQFILTMFFHSLTNSIAIDTTNTPRIKDSKSAVHLNFWMFKLKWEVYLKMPFLGFLLFISNFWLQKMLIFSFDFHVVFNHQAIFLVIKYRICFKWLRNLHNWLVVSWGNVFPRKT